MHSECNSDGDGDGDGDSDNTTPLKIDHLNAAMAAAECAPSR